MKKKSKTILILIISLIFIFVLDIICIYIIKRPLLAIKEDNGDSVNCVYRGILYDTLYCHEYSTPMIRRKGTKISCSINHLDLGKVIDIKDKTKNKLNFACAEVLESFYEDEKYIYFWECSKNKYMLVEYENGFEETISNALKYETIKINDLDLYDISYIKQEKEVTFDTKIKVIKSNIPNNNKYNKYLEQADRTVYLKDNIEEIYYEENATSYKLKTYISTTWQTLDDSIKHLTNLMTKIDVLKDGGTTLYKSIEYDLTIIKCNTLSNNIDIYIGDYNMNFDNDIMCK